MKIPSGVCAALRWVRKQVGSSLCLPPLKTYCFICQGLFVLSIMFLCLLRWIVCLSIAPSNVCLPVFFGYYLLAPHARVIIYQFVWSLELFIGSARSSLRNKSRCKSIIPTWSVQLRVYSEDTHLNCGVYLCMHAASLLAAVHSFILFQIQGEGLEEISAAWKSVPPSAK